MIVSPWWWTLFSCMKVRCAQCWPTIMTWTFTLRLATTLFPWSAQNLIIENFLKMILCEEPTVCVSLKFFKVSPSDRNLDVLPAPGPGWRSLLIWWSARMTGFALSLSSPHPGTPPRRHRVSTTSRTRDATSHPSWLSAMSPPKCTGGDRQVVVQECIY